MSAWQQRLVSRIGVPDRTGGDGNDDAGGDHGGDLPPGAESSTAAAVPPAVGHSRRKLQL